MNTIKIQPVQIWTKSGVKTATAFEIRYINYNGSSAIADCHLWTESSNISGSVVDASVEIYASAVNATQEQCLNWGTDNVPFYNVLAINAGLSPVIDS